MWAKRKPIKYRGYDIITSRNGKYISVIDKYHNVCNKTDNYNHGSLTDAKHFVDYMIKKANQTSIC